MYVRICMYIHIHREHIRPRVFKLLHTRLPFEPGGSHAAPGRDKAGGVQLHGLRLVLRGLLGQRAPERLLPLPGGVVTMCPGAGHYVPDGRWWGFWITHGVVPQRRGQVPLNLFCSGLFGWLLSIWLHSWFSIWGAFLNQPSRETKVGYITSWLGLNGALKTRFKEARVP